ncbi:hypothetical protein CEE44_04550 [Candidatus Woesearchaeota archaeon B3_Woes]|nr:MAG: hypothetical protein CEE44_04550 [Candidatus Woesearchaeota archaeon B3_Woes]
MLNKRGQVTIFIIIGIIIIASLIFFSMQTDLTMRGDVWIEETSKIPADVIPIKNYVDNCIKDIVEDEVIWLSLQGGYYNVVDGYDYEFIEIPFYFYLGESKFPSKSVIEREFSKYMEDKLPECINDFESFREIGYEINAGSISVDTSLGKMLNMKVKYPISVKKQESKTDIKSFYLDYNFNFDKLYNILSDFAVEHQKNPDFVPIGHLSLAAYNNGFTYDLIYGDNNSVVYSLIFNDLLDDEKTLLFNFAAQYGWYELQAVAEDIQLKSIPPQQAFPDYEFVYQVVSLNATNLKFSDFSGLFDIDENTGVIRFTPNIEDRGTHSVMIKAEDDNGNEGSVVFELEVVTENNPPVIEDLQDLHFYVGDDVSSALVRAPVHATDPDGDAIWFAVETSLPNFNINPSTGDMSFAPEPGQEGRYTVTVLVFDVNTESDSDSFIVEVEKWERP